MNICRYCALPVANPVKTLAYWNQTPDVCHPECKVAGEKQESVDCQVIDADCNDCRHFLRGELVKRWLSDIKDGMKTKTLTNMGIVKGRCAKLRTETEAYPHMSTGRPCFEHRRELSP